jgi:hypothetical protein
MTMLLLMMTAGRPVPEVLISILGAEPARFSVAPVSRNVDPVPEDAVAVPFQTSLLTVNVPLVPRSTFDVSVPLVEGKPVDAGKISILVSFTDVGTVEPNQFVPVDHAYVPDQVGLGFCVHVYVTAEAVEAIRLAVAISVATAVRPTRPVRRRSRVRHAPPPILFTIGRMLFPPTEKGCNKPRTPSLPDFPSSISGKLSLCQISVKHPTRNN